MLTLPSRTRGFGPVCIERLRAKGLVVGGKPLAYPLARRRRWTDPRQLPLEGMGA